MDLSDGLLKKVKNKILKVIEDEFHGYRFTKESVFDITKRIINVTRVTRRLKI